MPISPREAAARWSVLAREKAKNYRSDPDALEMLREAYVMERMTVEEFEAEIAKLLAGHGA